ncbi:MAG: hypothetical protein ACR2H3_02670 [Acidimicrobiales bacterium]
MPSLPAWTALPASLDLLLNRMLNVREYPVFSQGRARCETVLLVDNATDPHDWQLWRTGNFLASYDGRVEQWPVYLRRCAACKSVEVRREGWRQTIRSNKPRAITRTPGAADELLGWYQG